MAGVRIGPSVARKRHLDGPLGALSLIHGAPQSYSCVFAYAVGPGLAIISPLVWPCCAAPPTMQTGEYRSVCGSRPRVGVQGYAVAPTTPISCSAPPLASLRSGAVLARTSTSTHATSQRHRPCWRLYHGCDGIGKCPRIRSSQAIVVTSEIRFMLRRVDLISRQ